MKTFIVICSVLLFSTITCENEQSLIIKDFLLRQNKPTKINMISCWNKVKTTQLLKVLFENNFQVSVSNANFVQRLIPEHQFYIIDLTCNGWEAILTKAEEMKLFRFPNRWLALSENLDLGFLDRLKLSMDSQFFILDGTKVGAVYKIRENFELLVNDIGTWGKDLGFQYFNELIVSRNRSDLKGFTVNISTVVTNMDSLNHIWDYKDLHIDTISKANYIFCHHLTDMINASRHFVIQKTWGAKNATTSQYNGMIGDLQRGEADLGGIVSFLTEDRFTIIDYLSSTTPARAVFIFRAPPLSYVQNIFTLPFDDLVWISIFVLIIVTSLVLYVITIWEFNNSNYWGDHISRLRANFFDALMVQIGGVSQQGSDSEPTSSAGRIALIFSFTALMFLYTSFSANIVGLLQTSSESIQGLDDLLRLPIKLGVEDTPYNRYYFAVEDEPVRKALYQEKIAPNGLKPNFLPVEEGVARMRRELFAFHVESGTGYKIVGATFQEHEKCGLKEISFLKMPEPWLPAKKHSGFKEIFKVALRKIHERGIQNRELSRFFAKKPTCTGKGRSFVSVGLIDCYFGFLIFGVGVGFSTILLVLEYLTTKYITKKTIRRLTKFKINS